MGHPLTMSQPSRQACEGLPNVCEGMPTDSRAAFEPPIRFVRAAVGQAGTGEIRGRHCNYTYLDSGSVGCITHTFSPATDPATCELYSSEVEGVVVPRAGTLAAAPGPATLLTHPGPTLGLAHVHCSVRLWRSSCTE